MTGSVARVGLGNEQFTASLGQTLSEESDEIIASPDDNVSLSPFSSEPLIVSYGMQMPAFVSVVKKDPFGLRSRDIPGINDALDKLEVAFENYDPRSGANLEEINLTCFRGLRVCNNEHLNLEDLLKQLTDKTQYPLCRANLSRAILADVDLARAILVGADLTGANLLRANLSNANLINAFIMQDRHKITGLALRDYLSRTFGADGGINLEGAVFE